MPKRHKIATTATLVAGLFASGYAAVRLERRAWRRSVSRIFQTS